MSITALRPLSSHVEPARPAPETLVLANRQLRSGTATADLSRFGDDRWILTHALHEAHSPAVGVQMKVVPEQFRIAVKHATWTMINHDPGDHDPGDGAAVHTRRSRPAIRTIVNIHRFVVRFTEWLAIRGFTCFADVTAASLDQYAQDIRDSDTSHSLQEDTLAAVLRLWAMRNELPERDRLPEAPPWGGERIHDVLGRSRVLGENRTPRIHHDTMTPLLSWSLRYVEDFAEDIIGAFAEYKNLINRSPKRRVLMREHPPERRRGHNVISDRLAAVVERYRAAGLGLPGKRLPDGTLVINTYHLGRLVDGLIWTDRPGESRHRDILTSSGLPIDEACYLFTPIVATIDGIPWRERPITWDEVPDLARHLSAACYVIIGYLSGQRVGETLNLRRGCIDHDQATGLIFLRGKHFKGALDPAGNKIPEGAIRPDPWVVIPPVAAAVAVLERLHTSDWLFPNTLAIDGRADGPRQTRKGRGRNTALITRDLGNLCAWVNDYCRVNGRTDVIPTDPTHAKLHPSRLRRTLAWFIVRKPRGLVAAAIQYGHTAVSVTLGYSGSYASGFPDDLAFEEWLAKLETMAEAHDRLLGGEHVSGPAAENYRHRVNAATRFAGRVMHTSREAAALLADPDLQIYQGKGMTCVLDPHRAACRLARDERGHRHTPDVEDCRPHCANIARTDRDIDDVRQRAERLQAIVADPLVPSVRGERERRELERLAAIITEHERVAP